MNWGEGIRVALFCVGTVFALLTAIYVLIKLASTIITRCFGGQKSKG